MVPIVNYYQEPLPHTNVLDAATVYGVGLLWGAGEEEDKATVWVGVLEVGTQNVQGVAL